jgi:hypothetical protein
MITKEQALIGKIFIQTYYIAGDTLAKQYTWRANGKCKTWKRDPTRFQLPIKYGLYTYGYITNENAHLFTLES